MNSKLVEQICKQMIAAQDDGSLVEPWSNSNPALDIDLAYNIAASIDAEREQQGWRRRGRKIGFTNREMWALYGVEYPIWGRTYQHCIHEVDERVVEISLDGLAQPMLEPEIVFHFRHAPSPNIELHDLLECVDWIAHGFEIVQCHYPNWRFTAADTIIDNGLHAMLVVGPPLLRQHFESNVTAQLTDFSLELKVDGRAVHKGKGRNVLGSPLQALHHLVRLLDGSRNLPYLQAGELVTTGTLTPVVPIEAGQQWHTRVSGIGLPGLKVQCLA